MKMRILSHLCFWVPKRPVGSANVEMSDDIGDLGVDLWALGLLAPDSKPKKYWEIWLLLMTAYSSLELPLLWAFSVTPSIEQLVRTDIPARAWLAWLA
jgi:hypothetical protein